MSLVSAAAGHRRFSEWNVCWLLLVAAASVAGSKIHQSQRSHKRNQAFVFEHFTFESSTLISSFGVDIAGAAGVELLYCVTMGKVR